jgi:hypothetical protein
MAFGSGSSNVARADVEFRAETGKFEADVTQAKRIYNDSVESMSTATLRMSVAQEKLDRAISKFGPESLQARSAAVVYRKELNAVQEQADHTTRSVRRNHNEMVRAGRGAIAASGAFKGLGNALFFASSSFAGAFGIIYALRSTIKAAQVAQVSMTRLSVAVKNAGFAWQDHRKEIIDTIEAQAKLTSFDDEELQDSFSRAIIRTKDLSEAFRLNGLAADYARASGRSLEQSMTLVLRASLGQTASLKRLGIEAEKVTTNTDKFRAAGVKVTFAQRQEAKALDAKATKLKIIAALEAKLAGQSGEFAKTAQGRQERFNKVLEDTQEIIGLALLPTFTDLLTRFSEWLDKMNKSGDLQRKMNELLRDGGTAAHILAEGLKAINAVVGPLVRNVGGLQNAIELAIGVKLILSLRKTMIHFGLMGAASGAARTKIVADSAAEVVALNGVATAAGRAATATGAIGAGGFRGRVGGALARAGLGFGPISVGILAGLAANDFADARDARGRAQFVAKVMVAARAGAITPSQMQELMNAPGWALSDKEKAQIRTLNSKANGTFQNFTKIEAQRNAPVVRPSTTAGGTDGGAPPRTEVDIQLDLSRARARGDVSAEARADRELLALYKAQANNLERRKNLTLLQKQKLEQLYGQIASTQSELDGIAAEAARKDQERARKAEQARAKQRAARKQRLDTREQQLENALLRAAATKQLKDDGETARALIAFYRNAAKNQDLTAKERAQYDNKRLKVVATLRAARSAGTVKRLDLKEQRLENAVDRAELTLTLADDRKRLRLLIAFYRELAQNEDLSAKVRADYEKKRIAARKRLQDVNKQEDGPTGQQLGFDFLTSLQGTMNQFGGNLFAPGSLRVSGNPVSRDAPNPELFSMVTELREQTGLLTSLISSARHPGTRYARTEFSVAFDGPTF